MMPHWVPTNWFSAACDILTRSRRSNPAFKNSFRATAVTSSMEAELDNPAPLGISPENNRSSPLSMVIPLLENWSITPSG